MSDVKNKVKYMKLSELELLEHNPRSITKENMERLVNSIKNNKDYFEARPIICSNRTGKNVIIAGNQRLRAAKTLGMEEVPVVILENISKEKEQEIIIRDNVELGDWDYEILANEWDASELEEWGGKGLIGGVANGIVDELKNSEYIEKENYFIKKPFVLIFYEEDTKEKLAKILGVEEIENDTYDAKDL